MPKYLAKHAPEDSDDVDHEWLLEYEDGDHLVEINGLRSAEAHIIAFALNAVAEGHELIAGRDSYTSEEGGHVLEMDRYDGPTEGVAP